MSEAEEALEIALGIKQDSVLVDPVVGFVDNYVLVGVLARGPLVADGDSGGVDVVLQHCMHLLLQEVGACQE